MLRKSGRILLSTKKEVNHRGTENTEAKQKEVSNFKKSCTQRRGDAKNFPHRLQKNGIQTTAASILKEGVAKDLRSDNGAGYGNKHPKSKP